MQIDRADMKLLIEAGYSCVMRGLAVDPTPIFEAINEWMPRFAAGEIGLALGEMTAGRFAEADARLAAVLVSDREGRDEARAILAMSKALQHQHDEARRLRCELQGAGGAAEAFTALLVEGEPETTQGNQGLALEAGATPAGDGRDAERA
jgi:hypothetical protein